MGCWEQAQNSGPDETPKVGGKERMEIGKEDWESGAVTDPISTRKHSLVLLITLCVPQPIITLL